MASVLVTGSAGFVGSHLVSKLVTQNYSVLGISITKQKRTKNFTPIKADIRKIKTSDTPRRLDTIIHLAALSDLEYCKKNPVKCFQTNVNGSQRMLEVARKNDSKFIFVSSSHVFGKPKRLPIDENHPKESFSVYSASKIAAEELCKTYSQNYGMDVTVVRPFSIYGPLCPKHNVIFQIIHQLLKDNLIYLGNLKPKRDFLFISDFILALFAIISKQKKGYHEFNVGTGKSTSIFSVCNKLSHFTKKEIRIETRKNKIRKKDILDIRCDYSKIKKWYSWKPKIKLNDGLKVTYEYYLSSNERN